MLAVNFLHFQVWFVSIVSKQQNTGRKQGRANISDVDQICCQSHGEKKSIMNRAEDIAFAFWLLIFLAAGSGDNFNSTTLSSLHPMSVNPAMLMMKLLALCLIWSDWWLACWISFLPRDNWGRGCDDLAFEWCRLALLDHTRMRLAHKPRQGLAAV